VRSHKNILDNIREIKSGCRGSVDKALELGGSRRFFLGVIYPYLIVRKED